MIEIQRWTGDYVDGKPVVNKLFVAIIRDGKKLDRSPLLECSGKYEGCYLYNGAVYENWINWGFDELFRLDETDLQARHQDREGRVGETYAVSLMGEHTDIIKGTPSPIKENKVRKHSDGWGCLANAAI